MPSPASAARPMNFGELGVRGLVCRASEDGGQHERAPSMGAGNDIGVWLRTDLCFGMPGPAHSRAIRAKHPTSC